MKIVYRSSDADSVDRTIDTTTATLGELMSLAIANFLSNLEIALSWHQMEAVYNGLRVYAEQAGPGVWATMSLEFDPAEPGWTKDSVSLKVGKSVGGAPQVVLKHGGIRKSIYNAQMNADASAGKGHISP